ncbi:signal peptidase II [Pleionea sediminis]|uniref:signal peptidase II n=1 Tax=Pleionea sediminis TaxID=2569479 RepID=UPI00118604B5|nr:signal peptidase II [Pleionea sediminis]
MVNKAWNSGLRWIWITIVVFIIDQWTKVWATGALGQGQIIEVMPHFDFRLAHNYGAAFSFLADAGGWQVWALAAFALAVSVGLIVWLYRLKAEYRWLSITLCFILGGALGNVYDRISYGYVIDFIDWYVAKDGYHWPAFNIADSAVFVGAMMLLIDAFFIKTEERNQESK